MNDEFNVKKESINSFYNSIAETYEGQLTDLDKQAREEIARLFSSQVHKGIVLDFGGGTGLDLPWLLTSQSRIFFIEPSSAMRRVAIEKFKHEERITFLEDGLDFTQWTEDQLPIKERADGVLANFAVLNCINDIDSYFEKIAFLCRENCHLMVIVIDPRYRAMIRNYSITSALRLLYRERLTILNKNKGVYHETYLYTLRAIRKAARKYFVFKSWQPIGFSNFIAVSLIKR